jgi:hypothetical protein
MALQIDQRGWSGLIERRKSQRKINGHFDRKIELFQRSLD